MIKVALAKPVVTETVWGEKEQVAVLGQESRVKETLPV
jgi:hypothetical protein